MSKEAEGLCPRRQRVYVQGGRGFMSKEAEGLCPSIGRGFTQLSENRRERFWGIDNIVHDFQVCKYLHIHSGTP